MQKSVFVLPALMAALCLTLGMNVSVAAEQAGNKVQKSEVVYGSQLMTPEERAEYRVHMRSLKTSEERQAFRAEHHKKMQERAKAQGKTLPDMPAARGGRMAPPCGGPGPCGRMGQQGGGAPPEGGY